MQMATMQLIMAAFVVLAVAYVQAQPANPLLTPEFVSESLMVPETSQIGVPQTTAAVASTAAISQAAPGTTGKPHCRAKYGIYQYFLVHHPCDRSTSSGGADQP